MSIAVAERSKACGRSLAGIAGSTPAGGRDASFFLVLCVSCTGLWEGPITRSGEFYQCECVIVCHHTHKYKYTLTIIYTGQNIIIFPPLYALHISCQHSHQTPCVLFPVTCIPCGCHWVVLLSRKPLNKKCCLFLLGHFRSQNWVTLVLMPP